MENFSKVVVFDLDDTLIKEIDYLKSAYDEIANHLDQERQQELYKKMLSLYYKGENVFSYLEKKYPRLTINKLLYLYRNHVPKSLPLVNGALDLLDNCAKQGITIGLITDGRSITQKNKLKATAILSYFDEIIISEELGTTKPNLENFKIFNELSGQKYYIADNPSKDFITPNKLGWITICLLDNGQNIHKQNFDLPKIYLPTYKINSLKCIMNIIPQIQ